jgi:hypothetical protein
MRTRVFLTAPMLTVVVPTVVDRCHSGHVKTRIQCPCGETIVGKDEDELVELTNAHLNEQHDGRTYDREMILMMAT